MYDANYVLLTAAVLGALGMGLMLPRRSLRGRAVGIALGAVALGLVVSQIPRLGNWVADSVFLILAGITVVAAAATVTCRNPVYSAIWFAMSLLGTAGLFLFQGSQFLAVATVVVYAGAILVTFLFVLMLANPKGRASYDRISWEAMLSACCGVVIIGVLTMTLTALLAAPDGPGFQVTITQAQREAHVLADEHVAHVGRELFGTHLIAVEVAGTLLLAALVGAAVIVAKTSGPIRKQAETKEP